MAVLSGRSMAVYFLPPIAGEQKYYDNLKLFWFFAGGVILNGEGTDTNTQDFLANKGE